MNKVSPSVMCINTMELKEKIESLDKAGVDLYHIDIMERSFRSQLLSERVSYERYCRNLKDTYGCTSDGYQPDRIY